MRGGPLECSLGGLGLLASGCPEAGAAAPPSLKDSALPGPRAREAWACVSLLLCHTEPHILLIPVPQFPVQSAAVSPSPCCEGDV